MLHDFHFSGIHPVRFKFTKTTLFVGGTFFMVSFRRLIIGLFAGTSLFYSSDSVLPLVYCDKKNPQVCKSKECLIIDENWRSKVDLEKNPCEDFFEFACGKYNNSHSEIERSTSAVTQQLIKIAKAPLLRNDHKAVKMMKDMFRYCLNHDSNIKDIKKMITQLGGWALLNPNWKENEFSLVTFYSKAMQIGYLPDSLFTIDIDMNYEKRLNIIAIRPNKKPGSLMEGIFQNSWPLHSVQNPENAHNYMFNILVPKLSAHLGVDPDGMKEELINFGWMRNLIDEMNKEPRNSQTMKLSVVKFFYGNIPWNRLLSAVFSPITISDDDDIRIDCPKCMNLVNKFLNYTTTKALANYMIASFLFDNIMDADDDFMKDWLKYVNTGITKEDQCATKIFDLFRRVMDYEYIHLGYFDKSLIPLVQKFTQKLRTTMENTIRDTNTMDPQTKVQAIDKVKNIVFKIAYDDEIDKGQQALQYFDKLSINSNSKTYLPSLFNVMKYTTEQSFRRIKKPAKLSYLSATAENAEYQVYYNIIFLSVNVLTSTLYYLKGKIPEYHNFGGLGAIITHEMNHAFDNWGRQFDKNGRFRNWWKPETKQKWFNSLECIARQYSTFTNLETRNKVDGPLTSTENFADIGGIEIVYKAYHDLPKDEELLLPNFQYTLPQMFWLAYATSKCAKPTKEKVLEREKTSMHAELRIRVNGVAINNREFAVDWKCKENTPMNPIEKCTIWK